MKQRFHLAFAITASIVVITTVAWGFALVGSPISRRLERLDDRRVEDLQKIAREIRSMVVEWDNKEALKGALPKTLMEAAARARGEKINTQDPETGEQYGYAVKNETTFELCATFSRRRDDDRRVFWNHPAGTHCFTINVLDLP